MAGKKNKGMQYEANTNTISLPNKKFEIKEIDSSPCTEECPLGTNVKGYVSLIAAGRFREALDLVRETNPFPSICGRVCPHPCEERCKRGTIDEPIAIAALKRFLTDYELRRGLLPHYTTNTAARNETIAIIGAGPAGLSCGADLARLGYKVTVYEAAPVPGGMMALGIPAYRLPRDILKLEIGALEGLGLTIQLNTRVGEEIKFDDLIKNNSAVFVATGAQKSSSLGINGEEEIKSGIIDWVSLLKNAGLNRATKPGNNVVIIGGGNTAIDSARVCLRLGCDSVTVAYRRTRDQMPAFAEEVEDADHEGVNFNFLCLPIALKHEDGRLTGIECIRMKLGDADDSGRPRPVPIENSNFTIPCDSLISAIGQELDASFCSSETNTIRLTRKNLIEVHPETFQTSIPGVFAGGDAVLGPASIVEAISNGHKAAVTMHRFIQGSLQPQELRVEKNFSELTVVETSQIPPTQRVHFNRIEAKQRIKSFIEVNKSFTEAEALAEAQRCMRCGPCLECDMCVGVCEKKQAVLQPSDAKNLDHFMIPTPVVRINEEIHATINKVGMVPVSYKGKQFNAITFDAQVDEQLCRGCGLCEQTCGYHAIRVSCKVGGVFGATVDSAMCRGCGTCISVCPVGAIDQNYFTSAALQNSIRIQLKKKSNQSVYITCNWNPAVHSPKNEAIIAKAAATMCTGRIKSGDILKAFALGAQEVIILSCKKDACHYGFGCTAFENSIETVYKTLDLLGIGKEKVIIIKGDSSVLQ